jgi:hypothetical protein
VRCAPAIGGGEGEFSHRRQCVRAHVVVREHDPLRRAGGATRVVEVRRCVGRRQGRRERLARSGLRRGDRQGPVRPRCRELAGALSVRVVVQQQHAAAVGQDRVLLGGRQARVERHQDRTGCGRAVVGEPVVDVVVHQATDAIARPDAVRAQCRSDLQRQRVGGRIVVAPRTLAQGRGGWPALCRAGQEVEDVHAAGVARSRAAVAVRRCGVGRAPL